MTPSKETQSSAIGWYLRLASRPALWKGFVMSTSKIARRERGISSISGHGRSTGHFIPLLRPAAPCRRWTPRLRNRRHPAVWLLMRAGNAAAPTGIVGHRGRESTSNGTARHGVSRTPMPLRAPRLHEVKQVILAVDPDFLIDVRHMRLDGSLGNAKGVANIRARVPLRKECHNLRLSIGQLEFSGDLPIKRQRDKMRNKSMPRRMSTARIVMGAELSAIPGSFGNWMQKHTPRRPR